ncbi:MAG: hypothetical protein IT377_09130 [Polyangiaceae bacterium]|nr:hypothetical protein [Polyangiaceae bacterium]
MRTVTLALALTLLAASPPALAEPAADEALSCDHPRAPDPIYLFEMGYAPRTAPDPFSAARRDAEARFERRLCANRFDCAPIREHMKPGGQGLSTSQVCYRVVALRDDVQAALARVASIEPLEVGLEAAARELADELKRLGRGRTIVVGGVTDRGARGGDRSDWTRHLIERAFARSGLTVKKPRRDRLGQLVPYGAMVVLFAELSERGDRGARVFEARLTAEVGDGVRLPLSPASCGLDAVVGAGVASPDGIAGSRPSRLDDPAIDLVLDTGDDGQICEGDTTQIHVTTTRPLHVRVFDIFGRDGLAVFPNAHFATDIVRPDKPQPLGGPNGFVMIMSPGTDHERYLVIAGETPSDLGPWARFKDYCRLRPEQLSALLDTPREGFGRALVDDVSFRMKRQGCPRQLTDAERQSVLATLPPLCPP